MRGEITAFAKPVVDVATPEVFSFQTREIEW